MFTFPLSVLAFIYFACGWKEENEYHMKIPECTSTIVQWKRMERIIGWGQERTKRWWWWWWWMLKIVEKWNVKTINYANKNAKIKKRRYNKEKDMKCENVLDNWIVVYSPIRTTLPLFRLQLFSTLVLRCAFPRGERECRKCQPPARDILFLLWRGVACVWKSADIHWETHIEELT